MTSAESRATCRNVADGEQAHARVSVHRPLLCLAVGLAAVVHEAGVVPFWAGVNDAVLQEPRSEVSARADVWLHLWY